MAGAAHQTPSPTTHHELRFQLRSARHATRSRRGTRDEVAVTRSKSTPPKVVARLAGGLSAVKAERAGFEPATHLSAGTRFPVALLRPTRTPLHWPGNDSSHHWPAAGSSRAKPGSARRLEPLTARSSPRPCVHTVLSGLARPATRQRREQHAGSIPIRPTLSSPGSHGQRLARDASGMSSPASASSSPGIASRTRLRCSAIE